MDRRSFLKTSATGTAALAAASLLPGCASSCKDTKAASDVAINISFQEGTAPGATLAEKLDVSEMTVSRWVTNKIQPSMSQFIEMSKVLNVDIRELVEVDPTEISGSNTCDA